MVWNDVQEEPHSICLQLADEVFKFFLVSEFRVQPGWIGYVVTMCAAPPGLEDGRGVEIRDAEPMEIWDQPSRVLKSHSRMKL